MHTDSGTSQTVLRWPLVGRSVELARASELAASELRTDGPVGVSFVGAAGVGKSRLARAVIEAAAAAGRRTLWFAATSTARSIPLGAFAVVAHDVRGSTQARWLYEAASALVGDGPPPVVAVDDVHQLDELSAVLVHQLAATRVAQVVVTAREGEPLHEAVERLWLDGYVERVGVRDLEPGPTTELVAAALGGPVEPGTAARLWDLTRGNPLYLRMVVEAEVEAGHLAHHGAVWRWRGQPAMSPGLVEVVRRRMGRLPDRARGVLDALSIAEPLDVDVVRALVEDAPLEDLERRGVISAEVDADGAVVRMAHPLFGEVWRARLGVVEKSRLRAAVAAHLGESDLLLRATLLADSGAAVDPDVLVAGARLAAERWDLGLAERLARVAVRCGGGFAAQHIVATVLIGATAEDAAEVELRRLLELARSDDERARAMVDLAIQLAYNAGRPADALAALDQVAAEVDAPGPRLRIEAVRALVDAQGGRVRAAEEGARRVATADEVPGEATLLAHVALTVVAAATGRLGALAEAGQVALTTAASTPELAFYLVPMTTYRVWGLILAGNLDEARHVLDATLGLVGGADIATDALLPTVDGMIALARGDLDLSVRTLAETEPLLRRSGRAGGFVYGCAIYLTHALASSGRADEAAEAARALVVARHPGVGILATDEALARAAAAAVGGAVSEALSISRRAADDAAAAGQPACEVVALQACTTYGDTTGAARLRMLADLVDGPRAGLALAHAEAMAAHDARGMEDVSRRWEEIGDRLAAADAAARAVLLHRAQGRLGSAALALGRASRLRQACGGAWTPALHAAGEPSPLTGREGEVAALVAAGLSNRQIADRLVVSVRTVEGHVYRATRHLGVAGRAELAAAVTGRSEPSSSSGRPELG